MIKTGLIHEGIVPDAIHAAGPAFEMPDVMASGDWEPYLPPFERQSKLGLETMNCVQFSFLNVLETTAKSMGRTLDLSDRFLYWASGCTAAGNSYSACMYGFRERGACPERTWPWLVEMTRAEYGQEPPDGVKAEAKRLFEGWELGLPRYVRPTADALRAALRKGPVWFCNEAHSMMIYRVDDRIRVFDTYPGNFGDGRGSFPLEYVSEIVAAYNLPFAPKTLIPPPAMPNVKLPENCLVTGVFAHEQKIALHVAGKLIIDEPLLVVTQWLARNEDPAVHGLKANPPMRTIGEKDWNSFTHVNFKGVVV